MPASSKASITIRMYRQGLGDCFLLTFDQEGQEPVSMLIDCGLLQGTPSGKEIMKQVVLDIHDALPKTIGTGANAKKLLDHVLLTHEHVDHTSGFSQAKKEFEAIEFGRVWTSWLDDRSHPDYMEVRKRFSKQILGLTAAVARMSDETGAGVREQIETILNEFFDQEMLGAGEDLEKRSAAWAFALDRSKSDPKYCLPGEVLSVPGLERFRFYVLGPPLDYQTYTSVDPPDEETYRSETAKVAIADSFFAAVYEDSDFFHSELCQPFEEHLRIDESAVQESDAYPFFEERYGFTPAPNDWRRIGDDWLLTAGSLALNLDTYTNNTCLAIAIEFVDSGKVLLFPGDAQFANWKSWQSLEFEVKNGSKTEKVKIENLLNRTIFYKVGHHGSHNSTLKKHGLEMMTDPQLVAMIPVDRAMARSKTSKTNPNGWEMPEATLFETLKAHTRGRVILADEGDNTELKKRCNDSTFIDGVRYGGTLRRDPGKPATEPLYIELTISD